MPRVSVIVPAFNAEKYIDTCIKSIILQTFKDFELLIINDGSTDSTGVKCDRYANYDTRVRVFHQKNGGVTSARRLGVQNALGDFVTFVDSDDELNSNALEVLLGSVTNDDIDIVVSDLLNEELITGNEYVRRILRGELYNRVWGNLYKRELLTEWVMDIPRKINIGEDALMNIRIGLNLSQGYAKSITNHVYMYRYNIQSVTNTRKISLEYEELYIDELNKTLGGRKDFFIYEYNQSLLYTLENLIVCKVPVSYDRPWIIELRKWYKNHSLNLRQRVVLNISNNMICKYILAVEKRIKKLFTNA